MQKKLVNVIETEINKNSNITQSIIYEELNKKITINVDRGIMESQNKIANELIEIGCKDFCKLVSDNIKDVTKYIKKVNLNNPNKQPLLSKLLEIDLSADYASKTHLLYDKLKFMKILENYFNTLLEKVCLVENEFNNLIQENDFSSTNLSNKVSLLSLLNVLKEFKLSMLTLDNCSKLILNNPEIKKFYYYWEKYEENDYHFPKKCIVNDNAYLLLEYKDFLKINETNVIDIYNKLAHTIRMIKKYSKHPLYFTMHVGENYRSLRFKIYKHKFISEIIVLLNNLIHYINNKKKISTNETEIIKYNSEIKAIELIKNEFLKLELEIKEIIDNPKISSIAKKEGLDIDFYNIFSEISHIEEKQNRLK